MTRSLVTGAAGFMGSHVARHCLELGHSVVAADDLSGGFVENVPEGAEFREGSVSDAAFADSLFEGPRFDSVYHLAAYAAEGLSHFIRRFNYTNNVIGSVNLINGAVRTEVSRFVFTSSIAVYGTNPMVAFVGSAVSAKLVHSTFKVKLDGHRMGAEEALQHALVSAGMGARAASLAYALLFVTAWFAVLLALSIAR